MLKEELIKQINNDNYYTVPRYVFTYAKDFDLDVKNLILLIYLINNNNCVFDCNKIIETLNFSEKDLLDSISKLKSKKIIAIEMKKNDAGVLEERVNVDAFYELIVSKMINEEKKEGIKANLYETFEKEFGRTLSPMEYEIINSWKDSKISDDLILAALKETVFNGVNNLRYVDKILFEWNKKGIKKPSDISKDNKDKSDKTSSKDDDYEYDWLNE